MDETQDPHAATLLGSTLAQDGAPGASAERKPSSPDAVPERGTLIGRYVILSRLGAGGMGVVYAAYDPELDRKVAIKLLRPGVSAGRASPRLLREAQALAKLSHPNVVGIHDVGTHEEQVWLAMAYIEGQTLSAWVREGGTRRAWPEVLRVLQQVADGLTAAHARGLVHRDLKPDNIMIDAQGRAYVMDFGLVRAVADPDSEVAGPDDDVSDVGSAVAAASRGDDADDASELEHVEALTRTGHVLGTPAYMAPEQFMGVVVDAAVDQFGYCVTAWEALYGERPFAADSLLALREAVLAGERRPAPASAVPRWLRRTLERGLQTDPQARFPSMAALGDALRRGRNRARRVRGLMVVGTLAAIALGGWGVQQAARARAIAECEAEGEAVRATWSDARRQQLRRDLEGTGLGYAAGTADKLVPHIDDYVQRLGRASTEACTSTQVDGRWDASMEARADWCLGEQADALGALLDALQQPNATILQRAIPRAHALLDPGRCLEARTLEARAMPPPPLREASREVRTQLLAVDSLVAAGEYEQARASMDEVERRARKIDWRPLQASLHLQRGILLRIAGDGEEAGRQLREAYFLAVRAEAPALAASATSHLVLLLGGALARIDEAELWAELGDVQAERTGDALVRAQLLVQLGAVRMQSGRYEQAEETLREALERLQALVGTEHEAVGLTLSHLGQTYALMGDPERARDHLEQALAMVERTLGPDHPRVVGVLNNLASNELIVGKREQALAHLERALAVARSSLGAEHAQVASTLVNLSNVYSALEDLERAQTLLQQAQEVAARALAPEHPLHETILQNLAGIEIQHNQFDRAQQHLQEALARREKRLGPDHADLAGPLDGLGDIAHRRGDDAAAVAILERALGLRGGAAASDVRTANTRFMLARSLWNTGEHARALELARQSRDAFAGGGDLAEYLLIDVDEWLSARASGQGAQGAAPPSADEAAASSTATKK